MTEAKALNQIKSRRALKFSFSDYGFSQFVRGRMDQILTQFDANHDQIF
jgi:hypothetical protein